MASKESAKSVYFESEGLKLAGTVYPTKKPIRGVIFLHGSAEGGAGRISFREWQKRLQEKNISSLSFDSRGVGDSAMEGVAEFTNSTLANRLNDAESAYKFFINSGFVDSHRVGLVGNSMGGHVAARFAERHRKAISALLLKNAAAYSKNAEDKLMKPSDEFTHAIKDNWQNSPSFSAVKNFRRPVLLVFSEKENVIPKGVEEKYQQAAGFLGQKIVLPEVTHNYLTLRDDASLRALEILYSVSIDFFIRNL